ncbi:UDP-glycosyltransferase 83A1-like [Triticum dicoccoides]|uniref:UDP-glycosyltransferase 83A1-like n=1 Tax=Triticum dicoccoides TaxID=85692 RepID=UPI001890B0BF|nr:UDP-glycosyltransferase 83A1-like [Triticum dicoccoides]
MAAPTPHVLALPLPAQGHVIPLMELSHCLVEHGIKVTFVNTQHNHDLILASLHLSKSEHGSSLGGVDMVSLPDGLADGDDRKDLALLTQSFSDAMPGELEKLIGRVHESESESGAYKLTWIIADASMAWAFPVAKRLGLRAAAFNPLSVAMFATRIRIPELIRDGVVDEKGLPKRRGTFRLAPGMPPMRATELSWNCAGDPSGQPAILDFILRNNAATPLAEAVVTNSVQELEPGAMALFPDVLTVGPLLSASQDKPVASFWAEDATCAAWLDAQPAGSVVYVAFGSFAIFDRAQLVELAEALALTSRPFLWVVRPDSASEEWVGDLRRRAGPRGRVVGWCPQQRVLAHPSTACFLSHCGWNSTLEGLVNGLPFLCWPYFTDQFLDRGYICDVWRTGLQVAGEMAGTLVGREAIRGKVEELLGDAEIKARALALRDVARRAVADGGSSRRNLTRFVDLVRGSTS